jgi:thiol-disulfide isomerase/thioredoxin
MNRRHFVFGGVALAALGLGAYGYRGLRAPAAVPAAPAPVADPSAGLMARTLPDPNGTMHALSAWRGRPLLVNFWATWCGPCVIEMPELESLAQSYPTVQFVGVGIDSADNIRTFIRKVQVSYPLLVMDTGGTDLIRALGNAPGGLPFTVIFNADGSINRKILGRIDRDDVAGTLSAVIASA